MHIYMKINETTQYTTSTNLKTHLYERGRGDAIFDPESKIQVLDVHEIHHHAALPLSLSRSLTLQPRLYSYPRRSARASLFLFSPLGHIKGSITRAHVYYVCLRLHLCSISKICACSRTNLGYQIKSGTYNVSLIAARPFSYFNSGLIKRKVRMTHFIVALYNSPLF